MRAHDDLRTGDEAFASYGAKSNALLLANYGFVEKDNPHDDYVFPAQYPFPPLRGARVTRTGFDETVAKAAVSCSGRRTPRARTWRRRVARRPPRWKARRGPSRVPCQEHAKVLSRACFRRREAVGVYGGCEASRGGVRHGPLVSSAGFPRAREEHSPRVLL